MISASGFRKGPLVTRCVAVVSLVAAGCAQPADPPAEADTRPAIEVEVDTVVIRSASDELSGMIVATYTNRTDRPVYLGTCDIRDNPGFTMDKKAQDRWVLSYDPICPLTAGPPLEVRPGESRTDTLRLRDSLRPNAYRNFQTPEVPGTYRVAYSVHNCCHTAPGGSVRHGARLPREEHVSEPFRIELVP
jgi:hypothetical protein